MNEYWQPYLRSSFPYCSGFTIVKYKSNQLFILANILLVLADQFRLDGLLAKLLQCGLGQHLCFNHRMLPISMGFLGRSGASHTARLRELALNCSEYW
jgi:hypothetical protein